MDEQAHFEALKEKIFSKTGLDLSRYKENYLKRRVAARMRAVGTEGYGDYAVYLDANPDEYPRLKDRITVNVTEFFRDEDVYDWLSETLFPSLWALGRPLRVWSAGCSSGEEPYSLAILLKQTAEKAGCKPEFSVLATDLDEVVLAKALAATYPEEALARLGPAVARASFEEKGAVRVVRPEIRSHVIIEKHNLFADPPPTGLDLVVCRNVMIYFERRLQQRLLESFHKALLPGGYFLTGKTETVLGPARSLYKSVSAKARAFQREA